MAASLDARDERRYDGAARGDPADDREDRRRHRPADELAAVIGEALTATRPKARYLAGKGAREAIALARTPSDRVKDAAIAKTVGLPDPE